MNPSEDPRALVVSGFSFLTCALSSIAQTHITQSRMKSQPCHSSGSHKSKTCSQSRAGG